MEFTLCPPSLWLGNSVGEKEHAETHLVIFSIFGTAGAVAVDSATVGGLISIERSIQQPSISHFERSRCHLASK